jgi:L-threonylcarbamoyladenylate synthase
MNGPIRSFHIEKIYWENTKDLDLIAKHLCYGRVVAGTSDTVLGLLALATQDGFEALNGIKGRSERPYLILIDSKEKLSHFAAMPLAEPVNQLIEHCWPGPLTLVLKAREDLPACLKASDGTVALRIPGHAGLRSLLHQFPGLFSTSANRTTMPVPGSLDEMDPYILERVACLVMDKNSKNGLDHSDKPSTIVDCSGSKFRIIREGAYSVHDIKKIVGSALF